MMTLFEKKEYGQYQVGITKGEERQRTGSQRCEEAYVTKRE